jgi:hypothetical protein
MPMPLSLPHNRLSTWWDIGNLIGGGIKASLDPLRGSIAFDLFVMREL